LNNKKKKKGKGLGREERRKEKKGKKGREERKERKEERKERKGKGKKGEKKETRSEKRGKQPAPDQHVVSPPASGGKRKQYCTERGSRRRGGTLSSTEERVRPLHILSPQV
jgi:hypothetical protein